MKKLITMCAVVTVALVFAPAANGMITVDPDAFANGTDISSAFVGVTLSSVWGGKYTTDGRVYARTASDPIHASTGTMVFGNNLLGNEIGGDPLNEVWYEFKEVSPDKFRLRADFDNLANYVAIDMIGNDSPDLAVLEAYDSSDNLIASVLSPSLLEGNPWTAEISLASFNIAYIIASGRIGETIYLDNLRVNVIPAPGAILLGSIGVGLVSWLRRRRTL